jgi:hypothetical protein
MAEKSAPTPLRYYAVVLDSAGDFTTESFDTPALLGARLKELINQDVSVACFAGTHLPVSKPPFRHLQLPDGTWAPLFDVAVDKLEPDTTGYLGLDPIVMQGPPQIKVDKANLPNGDDDFFDDQPEDVLGAFDEILPDPDS